MILIGYSGHALVAAEILELMGKKVSGYCDIEQKKYNPLHITYLGSEKDLKVVQLIKDSGFFISVGENLIRQKIAFQFENYNKFPLTIIHPSSIISKNAAISNRGVMIGAAIQLNGFATIHRGVILNTGCIIEHECEVGEFAHIGPGSILCGNVRIGENTFVGAGSVIKQGVTVGKNVIIGAGSVVLDDIEANECVVGNPARHLKFTR